MRTILVVRWLTILRRAANLNGNDSAPHLSHSMTNQSPAFMLTHES